MELSSFFRTSIASCCRLTVIGVVTVLLDILCSFKKRRVSHDNLYTIFKRVCNKKLCFLGVELATACQQVAKNSRFWVGSAVILA